MAAASESLGATNQWHRGTSRAVRTQARNAHFWPFTHPKGLKTYLDRNETYILKGFVLLHSLVSVGRDDLHKEHPNHQTINVFSALEIMTIHQGIIKDRFTNESHYRPNIIYELGKTYGYFMQVRQKEHTISCHDHL